MPRVVVAFVSVVFVVSCHAETDPFIGPETYLTDEYFRKLKACEQRDLLPRPRMEKTDIGPEVHVLGRPARWVAQVYYLGDTCFTANVGPGYYTDQKDKDPDYYSISVEVLVPPDLNSPDNRPGWQVMFSREFKISDLPSGFANADISQIVSFDAVERIVRFHCGNNIHEYKLPAP